MQKIPILIVIILCGVFGPEAQAAGSSGGASSKVLGAYLSGIGVGSALPSSSDLLGANGKSKLAFDSAYSIEVMHDMSIGQPFLTLHGYGNLAKKTGTAQYSLPQGSGTPITGADVALSAIQFEVGYGARYRPFPASFISPFAGANLHLGYLRMDYDDSRLAQKVTGGSPSEITLTGYWGYSVELGLDIRRVNGLGLELLARRKWSRTWQVATLGESHLIFWQTDFAALLVFPF